MAHLPHNFNLGTLTWPNEIDFMRITAKFLGIQCTLAGHPWNSWDTTCNWQSCHHHMMIVGLCTHISHDFCACADLLTWLSNNKTAGKDAPNILVYSPVHKIPETEGLLVHQCSARLPEYDLTLWVVSVLMYNQEYHHSDAWKIFFCLLHHLPCGSSQLEVQV